MSAAVQRFEDLIAWQKARSLTNLIYQATRQESFRRDFGLCDQMRRAAVSVMSNVAEGFERSGTAEFKQFLAIAKASCGELRSQLYVAHDVGYLSEKDFQSLFSAAEEVSRIIGGLRTSLNRRTTEAPAS